VGGDRLDDAEPDCIAVLAGEVIKAPWVKSVSGENDGFP
jgi:hypothetical protein